jgi:hypothetical protein
MKQGENLILPSLLCGIGITCFGICLATIPAVLVGTAEPAGVSLLLMKVGGVLCFALFADALNLPWPAVLVLAVGFWSALIFGIQTVLRLR